MKNESVMSGGFSRRNFVKAGGLLAAASAMPKFSFANANGGDTLRVGVVGLGSRGRGAVREALLADSNLKVVALADIFEDQMQKACTIFEGNYLKEVKDRFDVPKERRYVGLDSLDRLLTNDDIDVVILTTPPVFRPYEMKKCLEAGKHVFAEKPLCVDASQARFIEEEVLPLAQKKGLSIAGGTQGRVLEGFVEGMKRLQDGQIGRVVNAQCYYYQSNYLEGWSMPTALNPEEMEYQIRRWLSFIWISGDQYVEQHIHTIDICMWALGDIAPVEVIGSAGRDPTIVYPFQGNRCTHFAVDYDFGQGLHMNSFCRQEPNTSSLVYTARIFGSKGTLELPLVGQPRIIGENPWIYEGKMKNAEGQIEKQAVLYRALRKGGGRFDNVKPLLNSNWIAIAGREAAYAGKRFKYEWIKHSKQNYLPDGKYDLGLRKIDPVPNPSEYQLT